MKTIYLAVIGILIVALFFVGTIYIGTEHRISQLKTALTKSNAEVARLGKLTEELSLEVERQTKNAKYSQDALEKERAENSIVDEYSTYANASQLRGQARNFSLQQPAFDYNAWRLMNPSIEAHERKIELERLQSEASAPIAYIESNSGTLDRIQRRRENSQLIDAIQSPKEVIIYNGGRIDR